jgi:hypothetical protein
MQQSLMKFDPATGEENPYPSHAEQWRDYHGKAAWLFNPWTGQRRSALDVGSDAFGVLIGSPTFPIRPLPPPPNASTGRSDT